MSADAGINVGTAITISTNGNAAFTGIITASNFVGNGANLTNLNVDASGWTPVAGSGQTGIHNSASSGAARVGIGTSIPHFVLDVGTVGSGNTAIYVRSKSTFLDQTNVTNINVSGALTATTLSKTHLTLPTSDLV